MAFIILNFKLSVIWHDLITNIYQNSQNVDLKNIKEISILVSQIML